MVTVDELVYIGSHRVVVLINHSLHQSDNMLFTRLAFFALPLLNAFAAPAVEPKGLLTPSAPSQEIISVLGKLQADIVCLVHNLRS